MATGVVTWSKTAASNASADSAQNWAEGMPPSAVNDSARGGMASVAKWRDDLNGSLVLGGTSSAYTLTTNQGFSALTAGLQVAFQVNVGNALNPTLAVDGLAAKPIRSSPGSGMWENFFLAGAIYRVTYFTSNSGEWIVDSYPYLGDLQVESAKLAAGAVTTTKIADGAVTYAKMQDVSATSRILGRKTSGAGDVEEITGAEALDFIGSTRGNVPVRGASGWGVVGPGTQGQVLRSDGTDIALGVIPLLHVTEQQSNNTGSSSNLTSGSWSQLVLNTTVVNQINSASVSSNQVSLPAGTYHAKLTVASPQVGSSLNTFKSRLRNVTDNATLAVSPTMGWSGGGAAGGTPPVILEGTFTLSGTKTIQAQFYQNTGSSGTNILGGNKGTGYSEAEIYVELLIWRIT